MNVNLQPFLNSGIALSHQDFRNELQTAGAALSPIPFRALEGMGQGHPFSGVLDSLRGQRVFSPDQAALWSVDFSAYRGDGKNREVCSHWAGLVRQGYYPQAFSELVGKRDQVTLLEDPFLMVASVLSVRDLQFQLTPFPKMPSLDGLSGLLGRDRWPLYAGRERVRIHGYWSSAYGASVHDILHFVAWKRWERDNRLDSVLLYGAAKSVLSTRLPSLGSLAGRIGARLFYGDGFFHRETTAMDECLSGPPGTGNGVFEETSLNNVAAYIEEGLPRFYQAVEKAFSGHPRERDWRQAVERSRTDERSKTKGAAA